MLSKAERLNKAHDFLRIKKQGSFFRTPYFKLAFLKRRDGFPTRIGFIVSNDLGKAVSRNLVRRRLRAIFRKNYDRISSSTDLILIGRIDLAQFDFARLMREVEKALLSARLFKNESL